MSVFTRVLVRQKFKYQELWYVFLCENSKMNVQLYKLNIYGYELTLILLRKCPRVFLWKRAMRPILKVRGQIKQHYLSSGAVSVVTILQTLKNIRNIQKGYKDVL